MDHTNGDVGDVAAAPNPHGEALEFVRFCHRRKHVGWPELYDEMCAVAGRGLYQGYGPEELAAIGIGFGLFQMPALANLVGRVVAEDQERRRRAAEAVKPSVVLSAPARRSDEAPTSQPQVDSGDRSTPPSRTSTPEARTNPEPAERAPEHGSIRIAVAAGA